MKRMFCGILPQLQRRNYLKSCSKYTMLSSKLRNFNELYN